ncbi:MAG: LPS export ABC transporter periplasmic protein LptC [Bacteroidetes bacterium]|uniref:LPS export ABC transporter periplasmic protein LptC n=1 Tax=Candidatus Cryptobacteroides faecigallinarum TaxID=2840763 RepID=A0A9D9ILA9_9BACT|nr:LPS export ABC transporter periplasmic protein LptC [Candidatus Cryptobacteroides faecigallinarum]
MKSGINIRKPIMIATAAAVAFVVYSCKGKLEMTGTVDMESTPVQTVDDMFVVQTENGLLKMRMESPLMERYQTDSLSYELFPKGIAVFGYNEEGLLETELTSDNARHLSYEDGRESWEAYGNVVVKNIINQEVMETDTLYWDRKNERLYTHCYVKLHSPDGFMQGFGMESDQRARESIIKRPFNSFGYVNQDTTAVKIDSANFIGPLLKK